MELENIVPWGRNFAEYRDMFVLSEEDLQKQIVGCGDGPASFNAEVTQKGGCVVSVDPIYAFSAEQIAGRIDEVAEVVMAQVHQNAHRFVWKNISDPDTLYTIRMEAMRCFLEDYEAGKSAGRYVEGSLPELPFDTGSFDMALCSHLLFLYDKQLDLTFHEAAVLEMLRVADEVRIFPLVTLENEPSAYLESLREGLSERGYVCNVCQTDYEFQKGGNMMLRIVS